MQSDKAPDYVTPFIGWRSWNLDVNGEKLSLRSVYYWTLWPAREALVAICRHTFGHKFVHEAPLEDHTCGIHALGTRDAIAAWARVQKSPVVGTVKLWGRMVVGTMGYRAQYAYPSELWIQEKPGHLSLEVPEIVEALQATYGIPIHVQ